MHRTATRRQRRPSRAKRICAALTTMSAVALVTATTALGYSALVSNGQVGPGGSSGPYHTLTSADVQSWYGTLDCVTAYDRAGNQAGTGYCSTGYTSHPYCQCVVRRGFNYPYYAQSDYMTGYEYY